MSGNTKQTVILVIWNEKKLGSKLNIYAELYKSSMI